MADSKVSGLRSSLELLVGRLIATQAVDAHPIEGVTPGLLDVAAHALDATLDRWVRAPALRQLIGGLERDALTSPGEWVELRARLGVAAKLGERATFRLGELAVAEVELRGDAEIHAVVRAPATGVYPVGIEVASAAGTRASGDQRVLQVTGDRPVVLFHAAVLLPSERGPRVPAAVASARALLDAGFELAYFDIHEKDRELQIRATLDAHALPLAAILVVSAQRQDLGDARTDFAAMFISAAVRKLRARGVPVTMVVSEEFTALARAKPTAVLFAGPEATLRNAHNRSFVADHVARAQQLRSDRDRTDRITWQLDQATESRLVAGNRFHAELDNTRARTRLFELIDGATRSIHLQFYIMRSCELVDRLVVALIRRARSGVQVRLMVDALYSDAEVLGRDNPLLGALRAEPNIEVLATGRIESRRDVDFLRLKQRDHRKIVIIDDTVAIVSGRNAADAYYVGFAELAVHDQTAHERFPWLDAGIELHGPLVAQVQQSFVNTWRAQGGRPIDTGPAAPAPAGTAAGRLVIHHGLADTYALSMYEAMLDVAEHHVYIVNDFPIVTALGRAMHRLRARGVTVKLLTGNVATRRTDGSFFPAPLHRTLFELMVKARLEPLLAAGVEIYEFMPPPSPLVVARGGRFRPYVHAKLMSVDGLVSSIGSANLDATASFWESEANVVVQDTQFAVELEAELEQLIAGSFRIEPQSEYWNRERAQRAVVATLWPDALYS